MSNKKQFFFLILFLGSFITTGFTACATRTIVPGWVEVEWQETGLKRHFRVGTSIQEIKEDFEFLGLPEGTTAKKIPSIRGASENFMKAKVNNTEKCNDYTLNQDDFVRVSPLLIPSIKCGRFLAKSDRSNMTEAQYKRQIINRASKASDREASYRMAVQ